MKPEEVLEFYGTKYKFNKETGYAAGSLFNWLRKGFIPEAQQYKIERLTKGALKACEEKQMSKEDENVYEAKQSIKSHIKFLETLLKGLNGSDETQRGRAMWAAWCLHRYIQDGLITDIQKAMLAHAPNTSPH